LSPQKGSTEKGVCQKGGLGGITAGGDRALTFLFAEIIVGCLPAQQFSLAGYWPVQKARVSANKNILFNSLTLFPLL